MNILGPTEVQWHAKARLVAGCEYYIVGRGTFVFSLMISWQKWWGKNLFTDPAGIKHPDGSGDLYDVNHGGRVLAMAPGLQGMTILKFKPAAYDTKQQKMDFLDEKRKDDFKPISGSDMRRYARNGETPPDGFMAPKAWEVLANYYRNFHQGTNGVSR